MAAPAEQWVVAIPTFDRLRIIGSHTLNLVLSAGIPPKRIFVFADPSQYHEYQKLLQPHGVNVVEGAKGVCHQRNKIMSFFPVGAHVVEMDDDIKGLLCSTGSVRSDKSAQVVDVPVSSLPVVIDHLFEVASREGCVLWGVYPVANPWMLSRTYSTGLTKATAQMMGYRNPGAEMKLTMPVMEDYERILRLYAAGKRCMRCDYLAVKTANKGPGGCASAFTEYKVIEDETRKNLPAMLHPREILESQVAQQLRELFPDLVTSVTKPKPKEKLGLRLRAERFNDFYGVEFGFRYHPPGWVVTFSKPKIRYISAKDVSGDFAEMLGLGPGIVPQKTVGKDGFVVDLRTNKKRRLRRRMTRLAKGLTKEARRNRI
ncbi:unnamed protein product [Symbiodinium sp. KB8]|nr:unnamed protein product [Symbiodinium sp. KB8]